MELQFIHDSISIERVSLSRKHLYFSINSQDGKNVQSSISFGEFLNIKYIRRILWYHAVDKMVLFYSYFETLRDLCQLVRIRSNLIDKKLESDWMWNDVINGSPNNDNNNNKTESSIKICWKHLCSAHLNADYIVLFSVCMSKCDEFVCHMCVCVCVL